MKIRIAPRCSITNSRRSTGGEVTSIAPLTTVPSFLMVTVVPETGVEQRSSGVGGSFEPPHAPSTGSAIASTSGSGLRMRASIPRLTAR